MLRSVVIASVQAPPQQTSQTGVQIGQTPATLREPMPTLLQPPRQLLSEIGRKAQALARPSTEGTRDVRAQLEYPERDLEPFACALTGTSAEVLEPRHCDIEGIFPSWLHGDLFRNGPGTWDIETRNGSMYSLAHWYTCNVPLRH